jgi:hypothetical protein
MRKRRYTEHLGLQVSVLEEKIVKEYLKSRKMTATEYFREVAIRPLVEAQAADIEVQDAVVD